LKGGDRQPVPPMTRRLQEQLKNDTKKPDWLKTNRANDFLCLKGWCIYVLS